MIRRGYYNNGQLSYEHPRHPHYKEHLHGMAKSWYSNGQIEYEIPYNKGTLHGIQRGWYKNGQLMYKVIHHQGQRHGILEWWNKKGKLDRTQYCLYGNVVTYEEYRRHELIKTLSGL